MKADELADLVAERVQEQTGNALTKGEYRLNRWQVRIGAGGLALAVAVAVAGGLKALVAG